MFSRFHLAPAVLLSVSLCVPLAWAQGAGAPAAGQRKAAGKTGAQAAAGPGSTNVNRPLLPASFAGDPREGDIVVDPTPATADGAHAAVLKEDGMVQASRGRYAGMGRQGWTVQAIRFGDATGAYAAFTFYRNPDMQPQAVGDAAAAAPGIFLVRRGAVLVIARADAAGASGGTPDTNRQMLTDLKFLVQGLPRTYGPDAIPPTLPTLLPPDGLAAGTMHYALGPAGYNGPLPVGALGFNSDAEVVTALYRLHSGAAAILTLAMLPTPEIAGDTLHTVTGLPNALLHVGSRRLGPLVAVVSGNGVSAADAQALLGRIHYVSDLTIDQPQGYTSEVAKAAKLLVGIAWFTIVMAVAAVLLALFLGFGRALIRRMQGKPESSVFDEEFITLNLK